VDGLLRRLFTGIPQLRNKCTPPVCRHALSPSGAAARVDFISLFSAASGSLRGLAWSVPDRRPNAGPLRGARHGCQGRGCDPSRGTVISEADTAEPAIALATGGLPAELWSDCRPTPATNCAISNSAAQCACGRASFVRCLTPIVDAFDGVEEILAHENRTRSRPRSLSRGRTRCPRCPASRCRTRRNHRQAVAARVPRRARPVVRIRPRARPGALPPRARCRPAHRDAPDS
jgi:hypothetical protein